jgi:hypothetical protein
MVVLGRGNPSLGGAASVTVKALLDIWSGGIRIFLGRKPKGRCGSARPRSISIAWRPSNQLAMICETISPSGGVRSPQATTSRTRAIASVASAVNAIFGIANRGARSHRSATSNWPTLVHKVGHYQQVCGFLNAFCVHVEEVSRIFGLVLQNG